MSSISGSNVEHLYQGINAVLQTAKRSGHPRVTGHIDILPGNNSQFNSRSFVDGQEFNPKDKISDEEYSLNPTTGLFEKVDVKNHNNDDIDAYLAHDGVIEPFVIRRNVTLRTTKTVFDTNSLKGATLFGNEDRLGRTSTIGQSYKINETLSSNFVSTPFIDRATIDDSDLGIFENIGLKTKVIVVESMSSDTQISSIIVDNLGVTATTGDPKVFPGPSSVVTDVYGASATIDANVTTQMTDIIVDSLSPTISTNANVNLAVSSIITEALSAGISYADQTVYFMRSTASQDLTADWNRLEITNGSPNLNGRYAWNYDNTEYAMSPTLDTQTLFLATVSGLQDSNDDRIEARIAKKVAGSYGVLSGSDNRGGSSDGATQPYTVETFGIDNATSGDKFRAEAIQSNGSITGDTLSAGGTDGAVSIMGIAHSGSAIWAYHTGAQTVNSTEATVQLGNVLYDPTGDFTHNPGSYDITVNADGTYFMLASFSAQESSGIQVFRGTIEWDDAGAGTWAQIPFATGADTMETTPGSYGSFVIPTLKPLSSSDKIRLKVKGQSGEGGNLISSGTSLLALNVTGIPAFHGAGSQDNITTLSDAWHSVSMSAAEVKNNDYFEHNVSTQSEYVAIKESGRYTFIGHVWIGNGEDNTGSEEARMQYADNKESAWQDFPAYGAKDPSQATNYDKSFLMIWEGSFNSGSIFRIQGRIDASDITDLSSNLIIFRTDGFSPGAAT